MRSSIYEAGFDQVRFILSHFHAKDEHFDYLMYCSTFCVQLSTKSLSAADIVLVLFQKQKE